SVQVPVAGEPTKATNTALVSQGGSAQAISTGACGSATGGAASSDKAEKGIEKPGKVAHGSEAAALPAEDVGGAAKSGDEFAKSVAVALTGRANDGEKAQRADVVTLLRHDVAETGLAMPGLTGIATVSHTVVGRDDGKLQAADGGGATVVLHAAHSELDRSGAGTLQAMDTPHVMTAVPTMLEV